MIARKAAWEIVARTYREVLGREPDLHGTTWTNMVASGVFDEEGLKQVFRLSMEYKLRDG